MGDIGKPSIKIAPDYNIIWTNSKWSKWVSRLSLYNIRDIVRHYIPDGIYVSISSV